MGTFLGWVKEIVKQDEATILLPSLGQIGAKNVRLVGDDMVLVDIKGNKTLSMHYTQLIIQSDT